ncbi:hypothetical protein IQ255_27985, partial [Pleurocapsales cyanobacterium LEGE 10410]|nr:hypothetical protein [Pleurocapsales cyanobacterium LEGE 10410]
GTINIFKPHRTKSEQAEEELSAPKLFLNAQLEEIEKPAAKLPSEPELPEIEYREKNWLDSLFSPWGYVAIAMLLLANLVSGTVIWRNFRTASQTTPVDLLAVGKADLASDEFMPLNLSTLSMIETTEDIIEESELIATPISPALAPLNNLALSSANSEYYYILTEYTGDRSLSLARQKVGQVSLVNFPQGVFIYLGAFTNKEQADEFIFQLKQENLAAHIYPFD